MSGRIEFAQRGRSQTFPPEWGTPEGSDPYGPVRAAWLRRMVRQHEETREGRRSLAEAERAQHVERVATVSRQQRMTTLLVREAQQREH